MFNPNIPVYEFIFFDGLGGRLVGFRRTKSFENAIWEASSRML